MHHRINRVELLYHRIVQKISLSVELFNILLQNTARNGIFMGQTEFYPENVILYEKIMIDCMID